MLENYNMGVEIKRNKKGYKLINTVSDEEINDGWIDEEQVKAILIKRELFNFMKKVIEIDLEFPSGYYINDKRQVIEEKHCAGGKFIINHWDDGEIDKKFKETLKRLNVEL